MQSEKMLILIVDDNPENRKVLGSFLTQNGYEVGVSSSGYKALEFIENKLPDLILLDIMMPEIDGFEVCVKLKSDSLAKHIPVIFLTAKTDIRDIVRGFKVGGADYVTKPFNNAELLARVNTHIEQQRLERELKDAKTAAEQADKQKSLFLANMSHEIRTPLNSVIGFTELLLADETDARKRERLHLISQSGENLLNIINDILDFSKIEADELEIAPQKFNISEIFELTRETFAPQAAAKGLSFQLSFHHKTSESFPKNIIGDSHRISQILTNLLSNAVKFTHQGSISIICTYEQEQATLKVVDTGIGIAQKKQTLIFSPFRQADASTTRKFGGTGLGLAITRRLVKMMGGSITLQSEPAVGSAFTVRLPLPPALENNVSHCKTDLAKTEIDGEAMVARWLHPQSDNAPEGFDSEEYVRLCLLDLPPKMTCLRNAVMRNLSQDIEFIAHEIKGSAGNLEMTEIYEAAMAINDEIIKKAYDINVVKCLFNNLENILASVPDAYFKDEMGELLNRTGQKTVTSDFKILVAEDDMMNQLLITDLLERINLNIAIAENGRKALDMLARENYDLLLLDIQMPVMDGMETVARIRADENLKNIHVIALTANALKGDAEKYIKAGCDDYLPKPIKFAKLYEKIRAIIAAKAKNDKGNRSLPPT
jgi:signal transduction histidine kinase/HPt (histidine-containing phosphotransfer) domain-containing protein